MKKRSWLLYGIVFLAGISLVILAIFLRKNSFTRPGRIVNTSSRESVSFSQEPVSVDSNLLQTEPAKSKSKNPPVRILIPALNIDLPVKEARVINGYWEVFPDVAGFGLGSAYPDEFGNQVIFAHAREGLFLNLKDVKIGQSVYVFTKDRWYFYKVTGIKDVYPNQTEVIAPTPDQTLTLFTCTGFLDSKRLIVVAKRI